MLAFKSSNWEELSVSTSTGYIHHIITVRVPNTCSLELQRAESFQLTADDRRIHIPWERIWSDAELDIESFEIVEADGMEHPHS